MYVLMDGFIFCVVCQPNNPNMVMDYWTGWYDVWGDLHHVLPPEGKEDSLCLQGHDKDYFLLAERKCCFHGAYNQRVFD